MCEQQPSSNNYNRTYIDENKKITKEDVENFRKENLSLNKNLFDALSNPDENRFAINDGVFDYQGYLISNVKILWIMKEPYDDGGVRGGWHISEIYKKTEPDKYGKAKTTWYSIINVSHAILSGSSKWDKQNRMLKNNTSLEKVLSHIAYINVQKLPSKGREKTNNSDIRKAFEEDRKSSKFFEQQFNLINPDIIIGANTLWMMFEHFGLKGKNIKKPTDNSYIVEKKLFINTSHPASRKNKEKYVNEILVAVAEWRKIKQNL